MKLLDKLFGKKVEEQPEEVKRKYVPPNRFYGGRIHKLRVYKPVSQ